MDFAIDLSSVIDDKTGRYPYLPRLPVQIMGVIILHKVTQLQPLLNNDNGGFDLDVVVDSNANIDSSKYHVIPIYSTSCSSQIKTVFSFDN